MGLEQREVGNFITILGGRFCQRVQAETAGATARINKLGKTVHEKYYDSFTGKLVAIRTQDGEYGKSWLFSFQDSGDIYHLQLPYSNSFAKAFLSILPNTDLNDEMKVTPMVKEVDGKKKSALFVNQKGVALKHFFTRDNPNGLPPMEEITIKGQKAWDDTKQLEFYYNFVQTQILPKLSGLPQRGQSKADKDFAELGGTEKMGEEKVDTGDF